MEPEIEKVVATLADKEVEEFDLEKGGIYVELTYDPRGWFLGDKTRRIFKAAIDQVLFLTNLNISVTAVGEQGQPGAWLAAEGGSMRIKVAVHNPKEISRMLTSKNDDVGSSVEYAKYDGSSPVELSAQPGQHVCIESITNGSYIRVKIFPGENAIENYVIKRFDLVSSRLEDIREMCQSAIEEIDKVIALELNIDKSFMIFMEKATKSEIGGLKRPNFFPYIQELNVQKQILLTLKFHIECQIEDNKR